MIHNKTNVVGFLICILLSTSCRGMEQDSALYRKIANLWDTAAKEGYTGTDLINDVLISALTIDPTATTSQAKMKQQEEHENIINTIDTVQMDKPKFSFSSDNNIYELARKIINAKKEIARLMNQYDDQWPNDSVPTKKWNKIIANKAIELIMGEKIHLNGVLKIINELIDQKARKKGITYKSFGLVSTISPLKTEKVTETKENIKYKIKNNESIKRIEEEKTVPIKEQKDTKITLEPIKIEKKQEVKVQEPTKIIVPEKVLLEKPIEQKPLTQEKPIQIQQPTIKLTEKEKIKPEVKKITEEPEIIEQIIPEETKDSSIAKAINILLEQNDTKIKNAYKKDTAKAVANVLFPIVTKLAKQFPDQLDLIQRLCTEKLEKNYGTEIESGDSSTQLIVNTQLTPFRKKYISAETAKKEALEKSEKAALAEIERANAQKILQNKLRHFDDLIKKAESFTIKTDYYKDLIEKADTENPIAKKDIENITKVFEKLEKTVAKREQENIGFTAYQAKKKEEEEKRTAQEKRQIMENVGANEVQANIIFNQQKKLESQVNYFTGLIQEAKKVGFGNIEQFTKMIDDIKAKKLYSVPMNKTSFEINNINKSFEDLNNALEKQLQGEKAVIYPEFIAKEIKENQQEGIGTVIVHKNSVELTDYIKDLAQQAKIKIVPDTWLDIKIGQDTFKFKQLSDGTLEYLKSPTEANTAIIADPATIHTFDKTIVPEIKKFLKPYKEIYPEEALADLKKRIGIANSPTKPVEDANLAYLKSITQEIERIKEKKGFGTVIVHPSATYLGDYIKTLAAQNGIKIEPNKWFSINFNNDTFIFKQLSDDQGTILYLKSPNDPNKNTTIANPNFFGNWFDNSIVPKIAEIIETEKNDANLVQQGLQDRINKAKLLKPTEQIATTPVPFVIPEISTLPGLVGAPKTPGRRTPSSPTTALVPVEQQRLTPEQQEPVLQPFVPIETEPTIQPTEPTVKPTGKKTPSRLARRKAPARRTTTRKAPVRRATRRRTPTRKRTTRNTRTRRTLRRPAQKQTTQQVETEEENVV